MQIPENAETKELTIQGITFTVPVVVTEDDFNESISPVVSPTTATQILQQTFMENWRNNFAKHVTNAIKEVATEKGIEFKSVRDLSDEEAEIINSAIDRDRLQEDLNEYIIEYTPGVRRAGTSGPALSPVDREAMKLAIDMVKDYLEREKGVGRTARSETYKTWDAKVQEELGITAAEYIQQMAEELIEANPAIRETAEATVASRKNLAGSIDLSI